jgi:hypothetical protein
MYLHVFDPHARYEPRPRYNAEWSDAAGKEKHEADRTKALKDVRRSGSLPYREDLEKAGIDPKEWVKYEEGWYDGSIRGMDAELGRFMQRLEELGLQDDILFAFVSDHGDEFQEHGGMWHGHTTYAELNQVPLVLYRDVIPAVQVREPYIISTLPTLSSQRFAAPQPKGKSLCRWCATGSDVVASAAPRVGAGALSLKEFAPGRPADFNRSLIAGWIVRHQGRGETQFELYDRRRSQDLNDVPRTRTCWGSDRRQTGATWCSRPFYRRFAQACRRTS